MTENQDEQVIISHFGLHILLGAKFPEMVHNVQRNMVEGRITLVQAVFERV